jgi:hypothetical protein
MGQHPLRTVDVVLIALRFIRLITFRPQGDAFLIAARLKSLSHTARASSER